MTFHQWLALQPTPYWCPLCRRPVTKWHEHHGPRRKWKPAPKWLMTEIGNE